MSFFDERSRGFIAHRWARWLQHLGGDSGATLFGKALDEPALKKVEVVSVRVATPENVEEAYMIVRLACLI